MINARHYVLDLETMGKGPRAAIVAIGCARIEHLTITGRFYTRVCLDSSLQAGLQMDASTVQWWLQQSDEARLEVSGSAKAGAFVALPRALQSLAAFMGHYETTQADPNALLWGNGSSFDNVIVGNAYDACGMDRPWNYWNDRDLRTLLAIFPSAKNIPFEGTKHHAKDDALHEAKQLLTVLQSMAEVAKESRA